MAYSCPSQDQQNFECVTIASVDFIKLPLKDILESRIQPMDLFKEINSCPALLSHKHKLRQDQLNLCFLQPPSEPDYRKFDVTLLYTLIRNLCPSLKPTKGWGTQPDDADIQIGDDIERLRLFRNNYYGHASSATISEVDFAKIWKDLKSIINRIQSTTKCSVDYEDELIKIERAKFTRNQLENCKVLLDALVILQQQKEDGEEPHIVIKGEDEIMCGCTANFTADVKKIDPSLWSIKWHKLSGTSRESIDKSKEKYRGSTDTTLVIQSVCKEDEGKYQAVISQESKGIEKKMRSNIICLHVGENLSDNQGSQQQLQESQHNVEENDNNWKAITKTEITTEKEMETLMLETMIKFLLTTIKKPSEFWLVTDLIDILEDTLKTINDCGRSDLLRELITAIKEDDDIQITLSRCGKRMYEVLKSMTLKYKSTELKITDGCVCFTFSFATYDILEKYLNLLRTGDDGLKRDISEVIFNKTLLDIFRIDFNYVTWSISKVTIKRGTEFVREEQFPNTVTRIKVDKVQYDSEFSKWKDDDYSFVETQNKVKSQPVGVIVEDFRKTAGVHHIALELQKKQGLVDFKQIRMEHIESYVKAKEYFQNTFAPERIKVINELISLRDDIQKEARIQKKGSVGIVGGGLITAGIITAPFTFGVSLALSIAGCAATISSGVAGVTHNIVQEKKVKSKLVDAQTSLQEHDKNCLKMSTLLVPLKRDIDRLRDEIIAIQQSRSEHDTDPENRNAERIVHGVKTIIGSFRTLNVSALDSNSKFFLQIQKIGETLKNVVPPSVSTAAKGAATIGTKALGTLAAVGILVDLGILISDATALAKIEKGKLCDEAEKLDNVITTMQNQYACLSKCFE